MNNFVEVRAEDLHRALALPAESVELTYDPQTRPLLIPAFMVGDTLITDVSGSKQDFTVSVNRERLHAAIPDSGVVTLVLTASTLTANGIPVEMFHTGVMETEPVTQKRRVTPRGNALRIAQKAQGDTQPASSDTYLSDYTAKIAASAPVWAGIEETLRISARAYGKPQVTRDPFTTHRFTIRVSADLAFTFDIDGGATYVTRLRGTERKTEQHPALAGDDYFACMHRIEDCVTS